MKAIVCADINWGIGKGTGMLFHIPADLKFFKEKTMGSTVIMGRTTFLSLPGQKALPGRKNIVLTRDENWSAENVTVCHGIDELAGIIENNENVFLMGGDPAPCPHRRLLRGSRANPHLRKSGNHSPYPQRGLLFPAAGVRSGTQPQGRLLRSPAGLRQGRNSAAPAHSGLPPPGFGTHPYRCLL